MERPQRQARPGRRWRPESSAMRLPHLYHLKFDRSQWAHSGSCHCRPWAHEDFVSPRQFAYATCAAESVEQAARVNQDIVQVILRLIENDRRVAVSEKESRERCGSLAGRPRFNGAGRLAIPVWTVFHM